MTQLRARLSAYLAEAEVTSPRTGPGAILAACDLAYARHLLGLPAFETREGFRRHLNRLNGFHLAGARANARPGLSVHLTAYGLASLELAGLELAGAAHREEASAFVRNIDWDWRLLIHPDSLLPRWPRRYSHHAWRVGHWIGGAPAILRLLRRLVPDIGAAMPWTDMPSTERVLEACDGLIDPHTGLLRTWRSSRLQAGFRRIYRLRHDPDAADIGGIAHLHWINHAEGRTPYKAADALFERAWRLMQRRPFVEDAPYCLDFDVVQLVRTAASGPLVGAFRQRAEDYATDTAVFLRTATDAGYRLHSLPGALAILHECALIQRQTTVAALGTPAIDIIKDAGWL